MWELDYKESWAPKNWCFELWCWRRFLRVPWTARSSNQSILKEISPEYSLEGLMLKLKLQYFGHLMRRTDLLEKSLMLGKMEDRRRRGQQRMKWLDGITAWWTWVWASSRSWWWTGKPGVLQSMGLQRVRHDWVTELNWTELRQFKHFEECTSVLDVGNGAFGRSLQRSSRNPLNDQITKKQWALNNDIQAWEFRSSILDGPDAPTEPALQGEKPSMRWFLSWCSKSSMRPELLLWLLVLALGTFFWVNLSTSMGYPGGSEVKASASNVGDPGSIPVLGRSPGEENGNPLQYSCLENPMATVHGVAKGQTWLSNFTFTFNLNGSHGREHCFSILWPHQWSDVPQNSQEVVAQKGIPFSASLLRSEHKFP